MANSMDSRVARFIELSKDIQDLEADLNLIREQIEANKMKIGDKFGFMFMDKHFVITRDE